MICYLFDCQILGFQLLIFYVLLSHLGLQIIIFLSEIGDRLHQSIHPIFSLQFTFNFLIMLKAISILQVFQLVSNLLVITLILLQLEILSLQLRYNEVLLFRFELIRRKERLKWSLLNKLT
jgi:hypothetical protein